MIKEIVNNIKEKYKDYYVNDIISGEDLKMLVDEIERLNNIIDELEKEINERITNIKNYGANFGLTIPIEVSNEIDNKLDELNYCLKTLKKLKGSDKE